MDLREKLLHRGGNVLDLRIGQHVLEGVSLRFPRRHENRVRFLIGRFVAAQSGIG